MIKNKLAIILTAKKYNNILKKALEAIYNQTVMPQQIIIVMTEKENFTVPKKTNTRIIYSKIKNQVYQRKIGLKFLNKNIEFILQLDDKIILEKNSIKFLLNEWRECDANTAGIAINPKNYIRPKTSLFHHLTLTNSNIDGKILCSGFANGWSETKKNKEMNWLNGGMTSWKIKLVPQIYNRKFPILNWSVCEDLFFSYNVSKKYKLLLSSKSKAKIILKKKKLVLKKVFIMDLYTQRYFIVLSYKIKNFQFSFFTMRYLVQVF